MVGEDAAKALLLALGKRVLTRQERARAEVERALDLAARIQPMGSPAAVQAIATDLLTYIYAEAERRHPRLVKRRD